MKPFLEQFNKTGAVITAVDLLRGLGRLLGWDVIEVEGATGYIDTDYAAKGRAAIETLKNTDFVVVHVEATDEASHEGEVEEKVKALENIDEHIGGPGHGWSAPIILRFYAPRLTAMDMCLSPFAARMSARTRPAVMMKSRLAPVICCCRKAIN